MNGVLNPPPAMRILRVAARTSGMSGTSANAILPVPSATDPTADRTTKSLRFMTPPGCDVPARERIEYAAASASVQRGSARPGARVTGRALRRVSTVGPKRFAVLQQRDTDERSHEAAFGGCFASAILSDIWGRIYRDHWHGEAHP